MEKDTPAVIWLPSRLGLLIDVRPFSCGAVT